MPHTLIYLVDTLWTKPKKGRVFAGVEISEKHKNMCIYNVQDQRVGRIQRILGRGIVRLRRSHDMCALYSISNVMTCALYITQIVMTCLLFTVYIECHDVCSIHYIDCHDMCALYMQCTFNVMACVLHSEHRM